MCYNDLVMRREVSAEGEMMEGNFHALEEILADIYEKTGANAYLKRRGGEETAFTAEWNGGKVELWLSGSGANAEREAKLVAYLLSETPALPANVKKGQLKSILLGEGGKVQAFRYLAKYNIPDAPCFVAVVLPDRRERDAYEHIERCLDGDDSVLFMDDERIAVLKFREEGQSPFEYGQFLNRSLYEEAGIRARIGVGCEMPSFGDAAVSYSQAVAAMHMSAMLGDKGEVHSYREYLLVQMLSDIPKERIKDCLGQFRIGGTAEVVEDEELFGTAEVFLESDLNLSETSRALFIHRNTLSYRLDKIERLTGLNIRKFPDAVTFRVITVLLKLVQE